VVGFSLAVLVWTVFALQDSAITALRRAPWIPLENSVYGLLKLVLLVPLAELYPRLGVFIAWVLAAAVILPLVNLAVFRRWLPAHARLVPPSAPLEQPRGLRRFLALDYLGSICFLASTTALPLLVVAELGAGANGRFYVAWTIVSCLDLISINLAQSLTVEASLAPARLGEHLRQLLPRMLLLQGLATVVLEVGAPLLLSLYGGEYATQATTAVRLLTLAVLPRAVIIISIAVARVHRRVGRVLTIQVSTAVGVLGLATVLARPWGIDGVAAAWLITQAAVAAVLLPGLLRLAWTRVSASDAPGADPASATGAANPEAPSSTR
jgi:O-antigen/teichoic acid export membrane protein